MRSTVIAAGLVACALVVAASGCGGSGEAAAGDDGTSTTAANRNDAQLKFARCMRDHGIHVDDPKPGSGGGFRLAIRGRAGDERKLEEAQKACQKLVPGGFKEPTAEEREKFQDAALKFARCMRAHGIDVPDPSPGRGGIIVRAPRGSRAKLEAAQKACQKLLPGPGPTQAAGS